MRIHQGAISIRVVKVVYMYVCMYVYMYVCMYCVYASMYVIAWEICR